MARWASIPPPCQTSDKVVIREVTENPDKYYRCQLAILRTLCHRGQQKLERFMNPLPSATADSIRGMERRYQVFISSTFVDLVDERREVMQALLEMDCLPAGMELFPAGNTDQWTLIQGVIEQSDYYLVILGGRYGSTTEEGISYTEKEYDYAVELGIPVMGFVVADPGEVPVKNTDKSDAAAA